MTGFANLFCGHLRRDRRWVLLLSVGAAFFMALLMAISSRIRPAEIQEILEKLPEGIRAIISVQPGEQFTFERWIAVAHTHPVWLILILAFPLATGLSGIAGGLADGTLENVLAQPVSRTTYYAALAAHLAAGTTAIVLASSLGAVAASRVVDLPGELRTATLMQLGMSGWLLALSVGGIALLISSLSERGRGAGTWAIGTVVTFFAIRFLAEMWPAAAWTGQFSIFFYHHPQSIIRDGLSPVSAGVLAGVAAVCAAFGLAVFRRRALMF